MQDLVLALEIQIDCAVSDPGLAGDIGDLRIKISFAGKDLYPGPKNCFAFVGNYSFG